MKLKIEFPMCPKCEKPMQPESVSLSGAIPLISFICPDHFNIIDVEIHDSGLEKP
jgi:hypothetical protein